MEFLFSKFCILLSLVMHSSFSNFLAPPILLSLSTFFLHFCHDINIDDSHWLFLSSSNFGVAMVIPLKGKVVTAKDVLASGPQPTQKMETVIVTLMHLALHSEKIELEVIFSSGQDS